jgi:glycine/D-amino acid oxidase-like deaminating enzyme
MTNAPIGIIGGGITGVSVAYHLAQHSERDVVVFEREEVASRTTAKSAGYVGFRGGHTRIHRELMQYSIRLYNRVLHEADSEMVHRTLGGLGLATSDTGRQKLKTRYHNARHHTTNDPPQFVEYYSGESLSESILLPDVRFEEITAALFWPNYGYVTPESLAAELAERARAAGATFETDTEITDIVGPDSVRAVRTDDGTVAVDHLILAAGPWNQELAAMVDVELPIRYSIAPGMLVADPSQHTYPSLTHHESGVYMRQHHGGRVFLGHYQGDFQEAAVESPGITESIPTDIRSRILDTAARIVPGLCNASVEREWVGLRSLTPDKNPIIGWTEVAGLSVATYNATGIQHAPAVGHILSRQILSDDPTRFYDDVSISRFDGYSDVRSG